MNEHEQTAVTENKARQESMKHGGYIYTRLMSKQGTHVNHKDYQPMTKQY